MVRRSVVTGIHGLQHVQGFFSANLADDDAIRPHTETVCYQLALVYCPFTLDVCRTAFEANNVMLFNLKFGGVLHRHDSFFVGDEARENIQQSRLS